MIRNLKPITENTKKKITTFWNWFQKNEQEIFNAFVLGINKQEVITQTVKKLESVSRRIDFIIEPPLAFDDKYKIVFTGYGYRKLFPKMIALENQAPELKHYIAQAFIKPLDDITSYREGTDEPCICKNFEIKISELQLALLDYDIANKKIKIDLYLPDYNELKHFEDLKDNINWIVMQVIGEIAFRKHIKEIQLHQMPLEPVGLLPLIELPEFIAYLYQINSRKKTRII
jgi:hypothetical protein